MSFALWILLLAILLISCGPPLLALVNDIRRRGAPEAEAFGKRAIGFYLALFLALAAAYLVFYFPSGRAPVIPTATAPAPGSGAGEGGALRSLSCVRAEERLERLQEASRGTIAYPGGSELRILAPLWQQMPPEARAGIGSMIAAVRSCSGGAEGGDEVVIRDLSSGRELARGTPASFAEP